MPKTALLRLITWVALVACLSTAQLSAATPSEELLPSSTKGYLSIADFQQLEQNWESSQMGKLANDPILEPFLKELRARLDERLDETGVRIGVTPKELTDVCSGEVCLAVIEPNDKVQKHAMAAIVDVAGNEEAVAKLLEKVAVSMGKRDATKKQTKINDTTLTIYSVPTRRGSRLRFNVVIFQADGKLFAVDHLMIAEELIGQVSNPKPENALSAVPGFQAVMKRCAEGAGELAPDVRWFIEPIGYSRVSRETVELKKRRRTDMIMAMEKQGFDALQGIGAFVNMATEQYDLLVHGYAYAPADPAAEPPHRFRLAARILEYAQQGALPPQAWVPADVSSYHSGLWDIKHSFDYIGSLVDEVAGQEGFWLDFLDSIIDDPNGPMIDIEKEIIDHFGNRISLITDCETPVTPSSERLLVAISLAKPKEVEKSIKRMMEKDPGARKIEYKGRIIWEVVPEDEDEEIPVVAIDGGDFASIPGLDDEDFEDFDSDQSDPFLARAAIAVVKEHLVISSHVELVKKLIDHEPTDPKLADQEDFQRVTEQLVLLGAGNTDSARSFARTDELIRGSYELLRQGRMPESEGVLGVILNRFMAGEEEDTRKQELDGKALPEFEMVRKYFGPAGFHIRTETDGWYLAGMSLKRDVAEEQPEVAVVEEQKVEEEETEVAVIEEETSDK